MRRAIQVALAAAVIPVLTLCSAEAATYVIEPDGSGDYATIQDAVDNAASGDEIVLAPGTFTGDGNRDIFVPARAITIRGQSGDYNDVIIDCEGSARAQHRGFYFVTAVGTGDATLQDIGIVNGYVIDGGGGIRIEGADPEIRNVAVANCTVDGNMMRGGGVYVYDGGLPTFLFCLIAGNAADYGGGMAYYQAGGTVFDCEIGDNIAGDIGGGLWIQGTDLQVNYSDIVSNEAARGGGIRLSGSNVAVFNCIIARNDATTHSGGVWLQNGGLGSCTLVENSAPTGGGVYCDAGTGGVWYSIIAFSEAGGGVGADEAGDVPTLECCDVYGNTGGDYDATVGDQTGTNDNFSLDPELCGIELADYRLFDTSPCLEANNPCSHQVGRYGEGCDSPVERMSWGRVKALWR